MSVFKFFIQIMKNKNSLIAQIEKTFEKYFEGGLRFVRKDNAYVVQGTEYAINRFEDPGERVKVKHWYSDIWIYVRIHYEVIPFENKRRSCDVLPFISISFFQKTGNVINQLFRAEWDSYVQVSELKHPQPHWHITSNLAVERTLDDLKNVDDDINLFAELFKEEKKDLLNMHSMHFAMAGSWFKDGEMKLEISSEEQIVNWMKYLFAHVHNEIDYMLKQ